VARDAAFVVHPELWHSVVWSPPVLRRPPGLHRWSPGARRRSADLRRSRSSVDRPCPKLPGAIIFRCGRLPRRMACCLLITFRLAAHWSSRGAARRVSLRRRHRLRRYPRRGRQTSHRPRPGPICRPRPRRMDHRFRLQR